jgi:hypothetical protein
MSRLLALPDDLFISALDHLCPRDLFEFALVCRRHSSLLFAAPPTVLSERLWRCICRSALPGLAPATTAAACNSWRALLNFHLQDMGTDRLALYAPVKRVWMRLERWCAANMPMTNASLLPGASAAELKRIESSMPAGFRLPLDYLVSCYIHQGCASLFVLRCLFDCQYALKMCLFPRSSTCPTRQAAATSGSAPPRLFWHSRWIFFLRRCRELPFAFGRQTAGHCAQHDTDGRNWHYW